MYLSNNIDDPTIAVGTPLQFLRYSKIPDASWYAAGNREIIIFHIHTLKTWQF